MTDTLLSALPQVLMITGSARSGSTLLGVALGQRADLGYFGELNQLWLRGFALNHVCGCGLHVADCPFWQEIHTALDADNLDGAAFHKAILSRAAADHSLRPGRRRKAKPEVNDAVHDRLRGLYTTLAQHSDRRWILDGSKMPIYAPLLTAALGRENVHILHLVRDPRGVAFSAAKVKAKVDTGREGDLMVRRSMWGSIRNWIKVQLSSAQLRKAAGSYLVVRYEDLCADPDAAIAPIMSALDLPPKRPEPGEATTHTVSGNPIRLRGERQPIRLDEAWRRQMPIWQQAAIYLCTLPLALRYGYRP